MALRSLHEDGARFAASLSTLEREQQSIHALLKDDADLLKIVQGSFQENLTTIMGNIKLLDDKFAAIQQRIEKK